MIRVFLECVLMAIIFGYTLTYLRNKLEIHNETESKHKKLEVITLIALSIVLSGIICELSLDYYLFEVIRQVIVLFANVFVVGNFVYTVYKYEEIKSKFKTLSYKNEILENDNEKIRQTNITLRDSLHKAYDRINDSQTK